MRIPILEEDQDRVGHPHLVEEHQEVYRLEHHPPPPSHRPLEGQVGHRPLEEP